MNHSFVLVFVCAAAARIFGQTFPEPSPEAKIISLEHKLAYAAMHRLGSKCADLIADDFVGIDYNGREVTKTLALERMAAPGLQVQSLSHEHIRVRFFGDIAIVTASTTLKAHYQGQDVSGEYPYMRVWIRRGGKWLAIAQQGSKAD